MLGDCGDRIPGISADIILAYNHMPPVCSHIQLAYSHAYTHSITAQIWGLEALRARAGGERRRLRDGALRQALRALRDS